MRRKRRELVATALSTTVLFQHAALDEDVTMENTALGGPLADLDRLGAENARLTQSMVDTNELQRLRGQLLELMKLRAEVSSLRAENLALTARETRRPDLAVPDEVAPSPTPSAVSTIRANIGKTVAPGGTMIRGGWCPNPGAAHVGFHHARARF